ncbi:MAG: opacity protein-like surface antigen, partial [Candidatus Deianiraeaceae bacterium]
SPMVGLSYQYSRRSLSFGISYEGRFSKFLQSLNVDDRVISNIGLVTALYTVNHNGLFQPYIGVGAGVGSLKMKMSNIHSRTFTSLAYQGMAGFKIKVSNKLYIFTDARLTGVTIRKYRGENTSDRASAARYLTAVIGFSYFIGKHNDIHGSASR